MEDGQLRQDGGAISVHHLEEVYVHAELVTDAWEKKEEIQTEIDYTQGVSNTYPMSACFHGALDLSNVLSYMFY